MEVDEATVVAALEAGQEAIRPLIRIQEEMREAVGKPKIEYTPVSPTEGVKLAVEKSVGDRLEQSVGGDPKPKIEQDEGHDLGQKKQKCLAGMEANERAVFGPPERKKAHEKQVSNGSYPPFSV